MLTIRVLCSRALDVVLRRRRDERLTEEIEAHLDLLTDEFIAKGMTPADARRAARRSFGGVDRITALYREQRGLPLVDALAQDVRFALRMLRRDRAFALSALLVLGIGIGVNNMFFTIFHAHTMRGLPIPQPDRVVYVSTFDDRTPDRGLSYPDFDDLRGAAQSFAGLAAFTNAPAIVAGDAMAAGRFEGAFLTGNGFDLTGIRPLLGRALAPDDDRPGADPVMVLGAGVWQERYGGDRGVLGRSVLVNGSPATIVGVIPDRSGFPSTAGIWLPLAQAPGLAAEARDVRMLRVIGRLRDGVTIETARAEVEGITERLARAHPETSLNNRARVVPLNVRLLGARTDPAWFAFLAAGSLIAAIAATNVANLVLARGTGRAREIAIRTSLGASRGRIVRQLLIEGCVLAAFGAVLGLVIGAIGIRVFRSAIPENVLPYWFDYSLDGRVVAALIGVAAATVLVFGLFPAIHVSRTDVNRVLKDGGRTGLRLRAGRRWSTAFLAAELGLSVILLAQLALNLRSSNAGLPSDDAIATEQIVTATITLQGDKYRTGDLRTAFHRRLEERMRALPGVAAMSAASHLPFMGATDVRLDIAGRPPLDPKTQGHVRSVAVRPHYFDTLGLPLTRGRDIDEDDGASGRASAVVNEAFVRRYLSNADPIGQRIAVASPGAPAAPPEWLTVIGVAPEIRQRLEGDPIVYVPHRAAPPATTIVLLRARDGSGSLAADLRHQVMALDPNLPVYQMRTMAQVRRDATWNGRLAETLLLTLTLIAVTLSAVGLYAVTAHAVSQRAREIGVRMALGAQPGQVVRLLARRTVVQLAAGFLLGIIGTMLWDRTFSSGRSGLSASDPQTLAVVAAMLTAIALIACFVPARRATRLDPAAAVREE